MSATTSDRLARDWARKLEDREAARMGVSIGTARKRVASKTGIAIGTLENLRRDRLKGVREWVYKRLQAALVTELRREHQALTNELEFLERHGKDSDGNQMAEIAADLEKVRRALAARTIGASDIVVEAVR